LSSQDKEFFIHKIKVKPGSEIIDLSKLNIDEKIKILQSVMKKSNKFNLYFNDYGIEVYQIMAIEADSVKLELFDSSWFNDLTIASVPKVENKDKHSQIQVVSINDILAIQIKQNNSFRFLIYPIIIAFVLIELLTII
tara:strand:- start:140 stop:553 length:414 start_codon:yes stop_codon:yes gene_type:complete